MLFEKTIQNPVTILILIDGFLQCKSELYKEDILKSHNPYFNRWFSAINKEVNFTVERETSQSLF